MIIFKIYTQEKVRNNQTASEKFFEGEIMDILHSKMFKTSRKLQRIFLKCIQDDSSKNLYSRKVLNNIRENFQFFGIKESLKIASKIGIFKKIPNQELHGQDNHKSFDLFINGSTY